MYFITHDDKTMWQKIWGDAKRIKVTNCECMRQEDSDSLGAVLGADTRCCPAWYFKEGGGGSPEW